MSVPALTLSNIGWDVCEYNQQVYSPTKVIDNQSSLRFWEQAKSCQKCLKIRQNAENLGKESWTNNYRTRSHAEWLKWLEPSWASVHWMEVQLESSFSWTYLKKKCPLKFVVNNLLFFFFSNHSQHNFSGKSCFPGSSGKCKYAWIWIFKKKPFPKLSFLMYMVYMVKHQRYLSAMNMHCSITQAALLPKYYENSILSNENT